jgi:hypothetical protein
MSAIVLALALAAQDAVPGKLAPIPEVRAYGLPDDRVLVFASRMDRSHYDFLRTLRSVPAQDSRGEPTSMIIPKHLKKPARAFDTERCYVESSWMSPEQLAVAAALVHRAGPALAELLGTRPPDKLNYVVMADEGEYHALVDAWAEDDRTKRGARFVSSTFVARYRVGYDAEPAPMYATAVSDAVARACPSSFRRQEALVQGLGAYVSAFLAGRFAIFVSLDVTTKQGRGHEPVEGLMRTAREYFARPRREDLGAVLRSELNAMTAEKLAVAFAMVDYLLRTRRSAWAGFARIVERESYDGRTLKGPEGCHEALKTGLRETMGLELAELDAALKEFTSREYLTEEDLARMTGVQSECAESAFEGFLKVSELRRRGKPVSGRGEEIYRQIRARIEKKLEARRLPF